MTGISSGKYTNIKLDCYLKKSLPLKDYLEVKTYEACVIKANQNKYHHRYVFLTNNALCVTTNPAKSILYRIHLKDVANIEIVYDSAKFLQKDLQNCVQHIVITYVKQNNNITTPATEIVSSPTHDNVTKDANKLEHESLSPSNKENKKLFCVYSDIDDTALFPIEEQSTSEANSSFSNSAYNNVTATDNRIIKNTYSPRLRSSEESSSSTFTKPTTSHFHEADTLKLSNATHNDVNRSSMFQTHLYILNENSTFFAYLKSAWENYILNSTLQLEAKYNHTQKIFPEDTAKVLYLQLKKDLLMCKSNEDLYVHFNELFFGLSKSILIKKMFWKDNSMLLFAIKQLRKCNVVQNRLWDTEASDRIELSTIIFTTLSAALRDVEAILDCYNEMAKIRASYLPELVAFIITDVSSKNNDLKEVIDERNLSACELLFDIFNISNQRILSKGMLKNFLTPADMFEIISNAKLDMFLRNVTSSCVKMCNKTSDNLGPSDAVTLFRCISTLHQIASKHYAVCLYAVNHLQEEFRYYFNASTLKGRLPASYPIQNILLQLVRITSNNILQLTSSSKP